MTDSGAKKADWTLLEIKAKELFSPAAPINAVDLFSGRTEQITRLLDAIVERGRHAILFGERGVGKTSLASIVQEMIGKSLQKRMVVLRKQASPIDDFDSLWRRIFRDVTYTIRMPGDYGNENITNHNIADAYHEKIVPDDVVRELAKITAHSTPVIIFDEFDGIQGDEAKRLMSHTIKSLSDNGINATIIIVGVADDINALVAEHESIKRNIEEIKMPRMSNDELKGILRERIPKLGMRIEGDARWKIITLSRGLPEYVHSLGCGATVHTIKSYRKTITEEDVDVAISNMLRQSDQSSSNAYKQAILSNRKDALYRQVLLACAIAETDDEGKFIASAVLHPLEKIVGRKIEISGFQSHIAKFCEKDRGEILEKHGTARAFKYRFREPKMQPYVIMQGINTKDIGRDALSIISAPEQPDLFANEPLPS